MNFGGELLQEKDKLLDIHITANFVTGETNGEEHALLRRVIFLSDVFFKVSGF